MDKFLKALVTGFTLAIFSISAHAAGGGGDSGSKYPKSFKTAVKALKKKDFETALVELNKVKDKNADNADLHNLLGYSSRKLGKFDEALAHYQKALEIDKEHAKATEYLGELYLQTNQLPKAEEQLARLTKFCKRCKERRELKRAIKKYKKKNKS